MNSFTGSSSQRGPSSSATSGISFDSYQFDFGISAGRSSASRPLRDQKPNPSPAPCAAAPRPAAPWTHRPARPSWTHQPAAATSTGPGDGLPNPPPSMVGDIFGKSWTSAAPTSSRLSIKNPLKKEETLRSTPSPLTPLASPHLPIPHRLRHPCHL